MSWAYRKELTHHTLSQTVPGQGVRVEFIPDRSFSGEQRIDVPFCVHIVSSLAVLGPTPWLMHQTLVCSPLLSIQPLTFFPLFFFLSLPSKSIFILSFFPKSLQVARLHTTHRGTGCSVLAEDGRDRCSHATWAQVPSNQALEPFWSVPQFPYLKSKPHNGTSPRGGEHATNVLMSLDN